MRLHFRINDRRPKPNRPTTSPPAIVRRISLTPAISPSTIIRRIGPTLVTSLMLCFIVTTCGPHDVKAQQADSSHAGMMNRAYGELASGNRSAAIAAFEEAVAAAPGAERPRLELAYLLLEEDRTAEAAEQFEAALELTSDPQVALQLGYVYDEMGEKALARRRFTEVADASDPELRRRAQEALKALGIRGAGRGTWYTDLYASPLFHTRHDNLIAPLLVRSGPVLFSSPTVHGYWLLRASRDTRSTGGELPEIFSDNVLIAGAGLRAFLHPWPLTLYAEGGPALPLGVAESEAVRADVRGGLYGSRSWGRSRADSGGPLTLRGVADLYYDVSYYSRFDHNVIGYLQGRPGLRLLQSRAGSIDLYARLAAVTDTRGMYFNNVVEVGPGVRWSLFGIDAVALSAEYMHGRYTVTEGAPVRDYRDFRVMLTLSHFHTWSR